uniref:Uncharacterized protein n=1 Tax=Heterorhabditis bacteriophora TaxID=37862 RepID=A0A1I7XVW9_HETBA
MHYFIKFEVNNRNLHNNSNIYIKTNTSHHAIPSLMFVLFSPLFQGVLDFILHVPETLIRKIGLQIPKKTFRYKSGKLNPHVTSQQKYIFDQGINKI